MRLSRLISLLTLSLALLIASGPGSAGHREGNGGDHIRSTFMKMGQAVLDYLKETQEGALLATRFDLDLNSLADSLTIDVISVQEGVLRDNGGSVVDATGTPGQIVLSQDAWNGHFERNRDVYYLVFHEMLRETGYDDDNYVISAALSPFPAGRRIVTRISSLYPLIAGENLAGVIDADQISMNGSGCPLNRTGTLIDFDSERNILDVTFRDYALQVGGGLSGLSRKNCALAVPMQAPAGKRLVVTQIDFGSRFSLPQGSSLRINAETFVAGSVSPAQSRTLTGRADGLVGRTQLRKTEVLRTDCGGSKILRVNTSATLIGVPTGLAAQADADRLSLYLQLEDCR